MHWLDVMGAPGSGKSTLCDHFWGPHELPIEDRLPPEKWKAFLDEIGRLFHLIREHPTYDAAIRMNNRSIRKIATVARGPTQKKGPYIQTALAQRGLGFGWRMHDMGIPLTELRRYFHLMPVSIGVAVTRCPQRVVEERNHARRLVKETAHEDRAHMVGHMLPAIDIALEVLHDRRVPILEVSTEQHIDAAREDLRRFSARSPFEQEASGRSCEVEILQPPYWWQRQRRRACVSADNPCPERGQDASGPHYGWVEALP